MKKLLFSLLSAILLTSSAFATDLKVSWDANPITDEVDVYRVYEKTGSSYVLLGESAGTELLLLSVAQGQHIYCVAAYNLWGEGPKSDEIKTPNSSPGKVKNPKITVVSP